MPRPLSPTITPESLKGLPVFLSVDQTAELLGLGRSVIYEALRRNELPARRIGNSYRLCKWTLVRWFLGRLVWDAKLGQWVAVSRGEQGGER